MTMSSEAVTAQPPLTSSGGSYAGAAGGQAQAIGDIKAGPAAHRLPGVHPGAQGGAQGGAEGGVPNFDNLSEADLTPVHSNYVPGQVEKHLDFLDFNTKGDLVVGCSSLVTRYWTGQLWYYTKERLSEGSSVATEPQLSLTGVDLGTGVVEGRFLGPNLMVVATDQGGLVLVTLSKERDQDRLFHYLEPQAPVVEHEDQVLGMDLWQEGGQARIASVGADLRLQVWGPSLEVVYTYHPAHHRLITGVACSPTEPHTLATSSQDGTVKVWDTRQPKPCQTIYRSSLCPPSCLTWAKQNLVVGTRTGALLVVEPRSPGAEPTLSSQFFDREVRRLRWSPSGSVLGVTADDNVVKAVEVRDNSIVEVYSDRRHTDYVRGLAWDTGDCLWSAGWDTKVYSHSLN